jgi:hypothetical protein
MNGPRFPVPYVVSTNITHAEYQDISIAFLGEIFLHRLISTICIAKEYKIPIRNNIVSAFFYRLA